MNLSKDTYGHSQQTLRNEKRKRNPTQYKNSMSSNTRALARHTKKILLIYFKEAALNCTSNAKMCKNILFNVCAYKFIYITDIIILYHLKAYTYYIYLYRHEKEANEDIT